MSIFTNALGGVGAAAQDMAQVWVKEESTGNLQKLQAELDAGKQRLINELQTGRDATQHTQRMEADAAQTAGRDASARGLVDYGISPEVTSGKAAQAGAIEKAQSEANIYQTSPGQELTTGAGVNVNTNKNKTAAQITDERVRARGGTGSKELTADDRKRISVYENTITQTQKEIGDMLGERSIKRDIEKNPDGVQARRLRELQDRAADRTDRLMRILDGDNIEPATSKVAPKSTTSKLPAGAKKIGTSGGKDVYEAPDGARYIVK